MESPSFWIGQFHRKKASRVPRSPGFSFGTIEWSCPGMIKFRLIKSEYNPEKEKPLYKETRLKACGAQIELRTHINIVEVR